MQCRAGEAHWIVPICLIGRGYDFKDAQGHLSDLEARLLRGYLVDPAKLFELRQALGGLASDARDPKSVQSALFATLPRIIAVNWEPESGKHQLDARAVVNQRAVARQDPGAGETPALTQSRRPCSRWLPLCAWPTHD